MPQQYVYLKFVLSPIFVAASLLTGVSVAAEPERGAPSSVAALDEIVVVAHKSERSVREIAANVTVITQEDINANLATSIIDVFRYAPSVDYEAAGSRFGTEGINIRGIGGNRVAMLVDGVPLSDQFDIGSFSNATRDFINAGFIQRVEVLHGPASALYGSSAIGGVVAVSTPDPSDLTARGLGADVALTWRGFDQSTHGTGMLAFGDATLGVLVGGSFRTGQETESAAVSESVDLRDYERRTGLLKLVGDNKFGHSWRVGLIHQTSQVSSDLNSFLGSGRFRSTTALEGDDDYTLTMLNAAYEFGSPDAWVDAGVVRVYSQRADVNQKTLDERGLARTPTSINRLFSFEQDIRGVELNLNKEFSTASVTHEVGFGLEYRERETTEIRDGLATNMLDGSTTNVLLGEVFPLRDFPISLSREWGAYLEDTLTLGDWSLTGALRFDKFDLSPRNDPIYAEDYPFAELVSIAESDVSPKVAVIYRINPATEAYVQYSHGFRAPPYEDANIGLDIPLFNFRAIPNPDLKSESSNGIDIGLRWTGEQSTLRLSAFKTRYADFIESKVRLGIDPISGRLLFQSQNIEATVIEGVEASASTQLTGALERISLEGSFYLARGENRDNEQPLNSVGPGQAVFGASWRGMANERQVRLQATVTDAWNDRDESAGALFKPAGNAVFDLYYSQRVASNLMLRVGILNLTDRTYWRWSDVGGLSADDLILPHVAQPGRNVSISFHYRPR